MSAEDGHRLGDRDLVHQAHVDEVAPPEAVRVEERHLRDRQRPGGEHEVAGVAAAGDVEPAARGGAQELRRPVDQADGARAQAAAAVLRGEHAAEAVAAEDEVGAGEAARRERDGVAGVLEPAHDGREEDDGRRVGDVDPDPHGVGGEPGAAGMSSEGRAVVRPARPPPPRPLPSPAPR